MKVLKVNSLLSRGNDLEEKVYKVKGFKAWSCYVEFCFLPKKLGGNLNKPILCPEIYPREDVKASN